MSKGKSFFKKYFGVQRCESLKDAIKQEKSKRLILIIGLVCAGLSGAASAISPLSFLSTLLMPVGIILIILGFYTYAKANEERRRVQRSYCPKCAEKLLLSNATYAFVRERQSAGALQNGKRNFSVVHTYEFNCTCAKCGTASNFEWDFLVKNGSVDAYGTILHSRDVDVEPQIVSLFQ